MVTLPQIILTELAPFESGSAPQSGQQLTRIQCADLVSAFTQDDGLAPEKSPAHQILESLLTKHLWLGCSCKGEDLSTAPVLYVQSTRSTRRPLTIVRNHSREPHHANCPFSRTSIPKGNSLAMRTESQALGILRRAVVASTEGSSARLNVVTTNTEKMPSIANVLFTVLERAGCNLLLGQPRSLTSDAEMINKALSSFFMDATKRIPALEYFGTNLHRFDAIARRVQRAAHQNEWPKNLPPHGFVIGLCEFERDKQKRAWLVEPRRGLSDQKRWQITGHVRLPGPGTPGPSVAIGLIAVPAGNQQPELVQAYVHPANSYNDLTLVDSDLERQTLRVLTARLVEMTNRGQAYSVVKPYLDINGPTFGARYRPDFIVMKDGKTIYIETMGYTDQEYLIRKARVHETMKVEQPVLQHSPGKNDADFQASFETFIGYI